MFTGLIEEVGQIVSTVRSRNIFNVVVEAGMVLEDLKIGDSIAISGVCQTVTDLGSSTFTVQAGEETLARTTFGKLKKGDPVNLERALRLNDRLGGHIVQGHVDGVGKVASVQEHTETVLMTIASETSLEKYIAEKGSIAIEGISLTVTFSRRGEFGVSIIPHTFKTTTLASIRRGDDVNLETDIMAKYIEKLIMGKNVNKSDLRLDTLQDLGF